MLLRFKAPAIRMTKLQLFDLQVSSLFSRLHLLDTICSARRNLKLHGHKVHVLQGRSPAEWHCDHSTALSKLKL